MIPPLSISFTSTLALSLALGFCTGCGTDTDRTVVVAGNQGNFVIQHEPNPMPRPAASASPTTRETAQQRRIDELEAQSRQLQAEIERLKREKGTAAQ